MSQTRRCPFGPVAVERDCAGAACEHFDVKEHVCLAELIVAAVYAQSAWRERIAELPPKFEEVLKGVRHR